MKYSAVMINIITDREMIMTTTVEIHHLKCKREMKDIYEFYLSEE